MPRPAGSKNRKKPGDEGYIKIGRHSGSTQLEQFTDQEIIEIKYEILKLLESGKCMTITEACRVLNIDPARVYHWGHTDKDFQEMVRLCREVVADEIEAEFRTHANFIPKMMLLKAYRPMFRDNYHLDLGSNKLEELLEELRQVGQKPAQKTEDEPPQLEETDEARLASIISPDRESLSSSPTGENNEKEE